MSFNLVAHHGTDKGSAENIVETEFNVSRHDELWLGDGAYFFDNNKKMAFEWCKAEGFKKRYSEYAIIQADIEAEENEVLDLDTKFGEEFFHMQREQLIERIKKTRFGADVSKKFFDNRVINDMCEVIPYRVVCHRTFVQLSRDRRMKLLSRVPNCRIVSVRDTTCIRNPLICQEGVL